MRYVEIRPGLGLEGIVRRFWFLRSDGNRAGPGGDPALPDGSPELIFNLGDPIWASTAGRPWRRQPLAMLVGQITGPLTVRPSGRLDLAAVRFEAAGASLVHRPMVTLTNRWVDLIRIGGLGARRVRGALARTPVVEERVGVLARWLGALRIERRGPEPLAVQAAELLRGSHGNRPVEQVCRELRISVRRLQRLFALDVGIGPKVLARILRFQRVFGAWQANPRSLARVAVECGYFDQPHLVRDFRDFAGVAPAAFLASQAEFTALFTSDAGRGRGRVV